MIGLSKSQIIETGTPVGNYSVSISPGDIFVVDTNGSSTSPTAFSTVLNGTGPFTYSWVMSGSNIGINSPSSANTSFSASGFNVTHEEAATLTVTDTGNGNAETSENISVLFQFFNI